MKVCNECGADKPLRDFYRAKEGRFGVMAVCKDCKKADARKRDPEAYRRRVVEGRQYQKTPEQLRRNYAVNTARRPEARRAYKAVQYALSTGKLFRKPCEVCDAEKSQAHHEDYSKPLDVIWLCKKHHVERHRRCPTCKGAKEVWAGVTFGRDQFDTCPTCQGTGVKR